MTELKKNLTYPPKVLGRLTSCSMHANVLKDMLTQKNHKKFPNVLFLARFSQYGPEEIVNVARLVFVIYFNCRCFNCRIQEEF